MLVATILNRGAGWKKQTGNTCVKINGGTRGTRAERANTRVRLPAPHREPMIDIIVGSLFRLNREKSSVLLCFSRGLLIDVR